MNNLKVFFVAIWITAISSSAFADVCDEGVLAVKKQNYKTALEKFSMTSKRNDKKCLMGMSFLNYFGYGLPQNFEQSFMFAQKSAQLGNAEAQGFLSAMYAEGQGVPKDLIKAHMWSNVAIAQGDAFAEQVRNSVSQRMGAEEVKEAQALAMACKEKKYVRCE